MSLLLPLLPRQMQATTFLVKRFDEHTVRVVCMQYDWADGQYWHQLTWPTLFADIGTDQTIRWGVLKSKVIPPLAKVCWLNS